MKKKLRQYQADNIRDVFNEFKKGNKRVIYQLPTDGNDRLQTYSFFCREKQTV